MRSSTVVACPPGRYARRVQGLAWVSSAGLAGAARDRVAKLPVPVSEPFAGQGSAEERIGEIVEVRGAGGEPTSTATPQSGSGSWTRPGPE